MPLMSQRMRFIESCKRFCIPYLIRGFLRLIVMTCRFEIKGSNNLIDAIRSGPTIIVLWHNRIALLGPVLLKIAPNYIYTAFVSNSRDGNLVADYITSYPQGRAIRVRHNAKEHALKTLIERLRTTKEIPLVTPDGPRGPVYVAKPGLMFVVKETQAQLIPFSWESSSYWELKTWDRFRIPKPFTTIYARFGEPTQDLTHILPTNS